MSKYIENNVLGKDEKIVVEVKKNSLYLVATWIVGILFCWLLFIPLIKAIGKTIKFRTTEYAVTNKKVIEKYGLVATHTDEMLISKIENITVTYTFFGKLFNYGKVCLQGTNRNNIDFDFVKDAEKVKKDIYALMENN